MNGGNAAKRTSIGLLTLSLGLAFASGYATDAPPAARPQAGFARYEFNKWLFFPCASTSRGGDRAAGLPFIDATPRGTLFKAVQQRWQQAADPLRGVYLEFSGYEEGQRVTATELWRALGWVESCSNRPTNVAPTATAWAAGNEPSWNLTIDGTSAVFSASGELPAKTSVASRADSTTLTVTGTTESVRLRAEFSAELCSDTMSEAAFGRRVTVAVNGRLVSGCGFVR